MGTTERNSLEPWISDSLQYYPHQISGVRELLKHSSFILADDMGLGKSIQALTVFAVDVKMGWGQKLLIVAPLTLKGNWIDEIEKFTAFDYTVLEGTPKQRQSIIREFGNQVGPRILIVHYEQVISHRDDFIKLDFDTIIFDEAHYLKNHKAKRTKASLSVPSKRSFMLTGTPMLNHVDELWTLLHRIDPQGYPGYWSFINRYGVFGGYKDKQLVGVKNEKELSAKLQKVMLRRLKKDVLDLPDVQIVERRVDLYPEQRELYLQVRDDLRLVDANGDEQDIENALTKFLRLKQICGTLMPFTGQDISAKLDLATLDAVEMIENGHPIVVFTQFRDVQACYLQRLRKAMPTLPLFELNGDVKPQDRVGVVKKWAGSGTAVIVCMLQVAGVGLNMTHARHAQFIDKLFVPGLNQQAIDRLHRIGADRTQPVQVFEYLARNTVETRVNQILRTKKKLFGTIVETDPDWKRKLIQALMEDDDD